jgi:hypothetical protein
MNLKKLANEGDFNNCYINIDSIVFIQWRHWVDDNGDGAKALDVYFTGKSISLHQQVGEKLIEILDSMEIAKREDNYDQEETFQEDFPQLRKRYEFEPDQV